jgi:hypothetical protein
MRSPMIENEEHSQAVFCPHCKHLMMLVRTIPACGALPELRTFSCVKCREAETYEVPPGLTSLAPSLRNKWESGRGHREHYLTAPPDAAVSPQHDRICHRLQRRRGWRWLRHQAPPGFIRRGAHLSFEAQEENFGQHKASGYTATKTWKSPEREDSRRGASGQHHALGRTI